MSGTPQAPGSTGPALFSIVAGTLYVSTDGGSTWGTIEASSIPDASLALTKLATQANNTVVGNIAGTASPVALTATQLTALINPASASLPGAMSAAQFSQLNGNIAAAYTSGLIDLTTTGNFAMDIPQRSGFIFLTLSGRLLLHDYTGTATGSLVFSAGNDAGKTNVFSNTIVSSTLNTDGAAVPFPIAQLTTPGALTPLIDSNTLIVGNIATAPTGVTSAHGYVVVSGVWLPV